MLERTKLNVKFINEKFYNMHCLLMFITAVCLLCLLKFKWPKNKSVYIWLYVLCFFCRDLFHNQLQNISDGLFDRCAPLQWL